VGDVSRKPKPLSVLDDGQTMSEHRIAQSKMRVKESRLIIEQAAKTRLDALAALEAKRRRRATE
jgi:hypothetical protein